MTEKPLKLTNGPYGFAWGPVSVTRLYSHNGQVVLGIVTAAGRRIDVYVSPTGRSLRVFRGGEEMAVPDPRSRPTAAEGGERG